MRARHFTLGDLRTVTGLIVGLYVTLHLSNHALGLISLGAQEAVRPWVMLLWHSPPGQILLYGSLIVHAVVALISIARRRHYRLPAWEATQMVLGLAVPYLLIVHIINTRGTRILTGIEIDYPYEIANLWVDPWTRFRQIALVLLVWGHFIAGLHFWWRIHAWYQRYFPAIVIAYVLVPVAALLGFAEVGMTMTQRARVEPQWLKAVKARGVPADPGRAHLRAALKEWAPLTWVGLVGVVFAGAQIRNWRDRRDRFKVVYPNELEVGAPIGMSVLEVSRMARQPHMSVCGGRARCTTCRIRVDASEGDLPPPNSIEGAALERIGAPQNVRLACQLRPGADVSVRPLLNPKLASSRRGRYRRKEFGEEREVTILFVDIRGSTSLAETRLPYDVVFVLNHLFASLTDAVEAAGGYYSNFTGDGLMALFGLDGVPDRGACAALRCALSMFEMVERLNESLSTELVTPMAVGVGIHTGEAIIGQMGPPKTPIISALGNSVNTAARLESATKDLQASLVVSQETLRFAGIDLPLVEIAVRGRSQRLLVAALHPEDLRRVIETRPCRIG